MPLRSNISVTARDTSVQTLIRGFYIYRFTRYSYFHVAIGLVYFQSCGLTLSQALSLESIYYISKAVCDVPGGYIADRLGRKTSLIASSLICALSYAMIGLSTSYLLFALAEILLGLAMSLATSSDSALLYDELTVRGASHRYEGIEGTGWALRNLGFGLASAVGAWIAAQTTLATPFILSALAIMLSMVFASLFLHEPNFKRGQRSTSWLSAMTVVLRHREFVPLVLFFAVVFVMVRIGFWAFQPILEALGIDVRWFGLLFGLMLGISLIAALRTEFVRLVSGGPWTTLTVLGGACFAVISLGIGIGNTLGVVICLIGFMIHAIAQGLYDPIMRKEINAIVDGPVRASTMSVATMLGNLAFAAVAPFYGNALEHNGHAYVMLALGVGFTLLALVIASWLTSLRRKALKHTTDY